MIDLFQTAMDFVWRPDNDGQPLHISPHDPGGATSWGVTFATWAGWRRLHGEPASMVMFKAAQKADFLPLYRALYWNSVRCGNMGAIGIQVFDVSMGSGPGVAARFLQEAIGTDVDEQIGPYTLAALNASNTATVNTALFNKREAFYAELPTAKYFARGLDRRAADCRDLVASLLNPAPAGVPVTTES